MSSKLPETTRLAYARQLADEAKTLVPSVERLGEIAAELRADDLYQLLGFDTWERFCADYIGVTKRTANRWIGTWKQTAIPARSTEQPKSIGAGQSAAAGQNVPLVESDTLKIPAASTEAPATEVSEGRTPEADPAESWGEGGSTPPVATGTRLPLADPSSGGAGIQPPPRSTGDPTSPLPAPPDPPDRPPSDRQLAARVFAAMREVDPTDAGPVTTPEEATFLRQWAQRTLDAWKAVYAPPAPAEKPQRRQGTITSPADRAPTWGPLSRPAARIGGGKRHADDCSCLSCKAPKAVAK